MSGPIFAQSCMPIRRHSWTLHWRRGQCRTNSVGMASRLTRSAMDEIELSLKLRRLAAWLDRRCQPDSLIRKYFNSPPFGSCYVTIDRDRQAPYASANLNRVYLCGTEGGMESDSVPRLKDLFATNGVKKFFVWLSP